MSDRRASGFCRNLCVATVLIVVSSRSPDACAVVVSDHDRNHVVQPGKLRFEVNLDGVVALGIGAVGDSSLRDISGCVDRLWSRRIRRFGDSGIGELPSVATVERAGLNRLETFYDDLELELGFDFDNGNPAQNAIALWGDESDLGFGMKEVMTVPGDS